MVGDPRKNAAYAEKSCKGNESLFDFKHHDFFKALYSNGQFTEEEIQNYRMAVTEREVRNGCINMPDDYVKDHVIIYTRILNNINLQNLKQASAFIDIMDRRIDQEAQDFLTYYRDTLAKNKLLNNKGIYKRYEIEWIGRKDLIMQHMMFS